MYSTKIKSKKFPWGGIALATPFPSKDTVSVVGSIAGGARAWGSNEEADVHAQMLLEGTKSHTKKELQLLLDGMGANLTFAAGNERLHFMGKVRPTHLNAFLSVVAECLTESTFPEPELAVLKMREASNLELESQNTTAQANIALSRLLYAKEHPNYDDTTDESVKVLKGINAQRLREMHRKLLDRRTLVLSMAGDITPAKAFALVNSHFKSLPQNKVTFPKFTKTKVVSAKQKEVTIPNKASIDYAAGIAAGITNTAGDYAALLLGMQILGNRSGFSGRLMKTVREEEGLTYGTYAFPAGFTATTDGHLYIWATFAPQLYEKGKVSIARQVTKILTDGVTADEVKKHRQLYEARSRVQLSNSGAFARAAHDTVVDGKPLKYLDEFPKKILKLTAAQVNKALKKYLLQNKLSEAAAGTFLDPSI
ncbi:MAG TPA: pitrilysin family protein [Candidatus Paceibacterota bacterium]|nr:pitrilysin family protein [Candidatus Paceibacterota bacterium]